jgi:alcohol dehydrogenase class IV
MLPGSASDNAKATAIMMARTNAQANEIHTQRLLSQVCLWKVNTSFGLNLSAASETSNKRVIPYNPVTWKTSTVK